MPILHFSFDDVAHTLHDLCTVPYASVFDQPLLHALQSIHRDTGAVFTLYCFNRCTQIPAYDIAALPDRYQPELSAASCWLRFGFHAEDDLTRYAETPDALTAFLRSREALTRLAGENSLDPFLRLGFFSGNRENVDALRSAGVCGLYSADDLRLSYALTPQENDEVLRHGAYRDAAGMVYIRSQPRLDTHTAQDVIAAVEARPAYRRLTEVFMHEYTFLHDPACACQRITDMARWANRQGCVHRFHSDAMLSGEVPV